MGIMCKIFGHKTDTITWFDYKRCPTGRCDRCDSYFRISNKKLKEDVYNNWMTNRREEVKREINKANDFSDYCMKLPTLLDTLQMTESYRIHNDKKTGIDVVVTDKTVQSDLNVVDVKHEDDKIKIVTDYVGT